jgi:uncharacterized protein YkwD
MRKQLAMLAVLLVLCLAGAARAADKADRSTLEGYATWASGVLESRPKGVKFLKPLARRLVKLTTARREKHGVGPLEVDQELLRAARAHAIDQLKRDYFGHVAPGGLEPGDRVALLHRRLVGGVGENLAKQEGRSAKQLKGQMGRLARKIMKGWMDSPGHRENVLDPDYTHLAIFAAARGKDVVVVQLFAERRALLKEPLPLRQGQGQALSLAFERGNGLRIPARYAYAPPGQPAQDLNTRSLSSRRVSVEPGTYMLKFLFRSGEPGFYQVVKGPAIVVQ